MEREKIIEFWGRDNLRRWPEASLLDVAIPASSKSFLTDVGLPIHERWTLRFDADGEELPRLPGRNSYRRIGFDDVVPICLDEESAGRVVADERAVGRGQRIINSSVEQFGECLVYYQQYRMAVRTTAEEEVEELIGNTERQMRKVDPAAFSGANRWWPLIIEQMNQGLL